MARKFSKKDGLLPADFAHCGLDHLTAAKELFDTNPSHFDSAGYLAHIGIELLIKGWLLEAAGEFKGIHNLHDLYKELNQKHGAPDLNETQKEIIAILDQFEQLRYPNPNQPTVVGDDNWPEIELFAGFLCQTMPKQVEVELSKIQAGQKSGRILMRKKVDQKGNT